MSNTAKSPRKIALYGMDERTCKTMQMYLKGPCHGAAMIVAETDAEIDMIDADHPKARDILDARRAAAPTRPLILLSLQTLQIDNTYFIKKPLNVEQMLSVIDKIKAAETARKPVAAAAKPDIVSPPPSQALPESVSAEIPKNAAIDVYANKDKIDDTQPPTKAEKHQSAVQLNEGGFVAFLGTLSNIDFDDETQLMTACYDARQFFLGYVASAYKTARLQSKALQLSSIWKPLLIFPDTQEIWLDADDKQTRAFAGMPLGKATSGNMVLTVLDTDNHEQRLPEKRQDMNAFIWKLAIWTSKGRFPINLDIHRPVFLEMWPNFTRLVITPDALRIAALLIQGPRSPLELASLLNVKPQYVFVFVSACHTLGILRQSERLADSLVNVEKPQKPKNQGLLSKILNKLRGA